MLNHIVLFSARTGREADLERILKQFAEDITESGVVDHANWGTNSNQSGLAQGVTHGSVAIIPDGRFDEYWNHPAHQQFLAVLDELCEHRFAIDYPL